MSSIKNLIDAIETDDEAKIKEAFTAVALEYAGLLPRLVVALERIATALEPQNIELASLDEQAHLNALLDKKGK